MFSIRTEKWFRAFLLIGALCPVGMAQSGMAQRLPTKLQRISHNDVIMESVVNFPGRGPVLVRLKVLPPSALHRGRRQSGPVKPRLVSDPLLFSSNEDVNADNHVDGLWIFPTIGFDPATTPTLNLVSNSIQTGAPSSDNFANVYVGQIGHPSLISRVTFAGAMFDINDPNWSTGNPTPQTGSIMILFYDGVDTTVANKPSAAKLAKSETSGVNGYIVRSPSDIPVFDSAIYSIDTDGDRMKITDPQGRFGIVTAKTNDAGNPTPATVEWYGVVNVPNGPNAVWQYRNNDLSTLQQVSFPANSVFNQSSVLNNAAVFNYFYELLGRKLDDTIVKSGTLQGNLRRRGINPPVLPIGSTQNPETKPGFYRIIACKPGTIANKTFQIVREDYVFSQPSYDSKGNLNDGIHGSLPGPDPDHPIFPPNYQIQGYPVGTYDFLIVAQPIFNAAHNADNPWDPSKYPFTNYAGFVKTGVTITDGGTTTLSARLELLGDIDDGSGTNKKDGQVEFADLTALAIAYNTIKGQALYNDAADMVGSVSVQNPQGFPDGQVEFSDLTALAILYNTSVSEP